MLKKIKNILLGFCLITTMMISCVFDPGETRKIKIYNNTSKTVYVFESRENAYEGHYIFYDSIQIKNNNKLNAFTTHQIWSAQPWKYYIENSKDSLLHIFIVSEDCVRKYGFKKIFKDTIYTRVYEFKYKDLKKNKWQIKYE